MTTRSIALLGVLLFVSTAGFVVWFVWPDASGTSPATRLVNAHPNDSVWRDEIKRLRASDPERDADLAIQQGDYRILGCYGVGTLYPGLGGRDDLHGSAGLLETLGVRMFEDTSDAVESDTHSRYIFVATVYANKYNVRLIAELERLGKLPVSETHTRESPNDERDQSPHPAP